MLSAGSLISEKELNGYNTAGSVFAEVVGS